MKGLGHDIVKTDRLRKIVTGNPKYFTRFAQRILHPVYELPKLDKNDIDKSTRLLASTWAAKESLFKSLDLEMQKKCIFNEWYRTNGPEYLIKCDKFPNEKVMVSVSHDGEYTSAVSIRI